MGDLGPVSHLGDLTSTLNDGQIYVAEGLLSRPFRFYIQM